MVWKIRLMSDEENPVEGISYKTFLWDLYAGISLATGSTPVEAYDKANQMMSERERILAGE